MKNAIILHGGYNNPKQFWYPSIKKYLENKGYEVWVPQLPGAEPNLINWLPFVLQKGDFNKNSILIGHSLGATLSLAVLENIKVKIHKAILIAGFSTPRGDFKEKMLQSKYDWQKIKNAAQNFYFLNSKNDPWGCTDKQGLILWQNIGGTLMLFEKEGHFGSEKDNQPYKQFPLLEKLLENNL